MLLNDETAGRRLSKASRLHMPLLMEQSSVTLVRENNAARCVVIVLIVAAREAARGKPSCTIPYALRHSANARQ